MEHKESVKELNLQAVAQKFRQFKYPILVLALGALLVLWPQHDNTSPQTETLQMQTQQPEPEPNQSAPDLQQQLSQVLSSVEGAGEVSVLLTVRAGEQTVYQSDESSTETDTSGGSQSSSTVIVSDGSGGQRGLAVQTIAAEYRGALVICEGADSARVRLNLVNAVADLTGLSADQITVIKMKS